MDTDILAAQQYVVNHNLGDVLSQSFGEGETGLITSSARMPIDANKESIVVAFVLNPNAKSVRLGTVGH